MVPAFKEVTMDKLVDHQDLDDLVSRFFNNGRGGKGHGTTSYVASKQSSGDAFTAKDGAFVLGRQMAIAAMYAPSYQIGGQNGGDQGSEDQGMSLIAIDSQDHELEMDTITPNADAADATDGKFFMQGFGIPEKVLAGDGASAAGDLVVFELPAKIPQEGEPGNPFDVGDVAIFMSTLESAARMQVDSGVQLGQVPVFAFVGQALVKRGDAPSTFGKALAVPRVTGGLKGNAARKGDPPTPLVLTGR